MRDMFESSGVQEIKGLKNFNTENVTDMGGMFSCCKKLKELDLSSFNTEKVTNMDFMFSGCSSLSKLILGDKFTVKKTASGVFNNCKSLSVVIKNKFDGDLLIALNNISYDLKNSLVTKKRLKMVFQ